MAAASAPPTNRSSLSTSRFMKAAVASTLLALQMFSSGASATGVSRSLYFPGTTLICRRFPALCRRSGPPKTTLPIIRPPFTTLPVNTPNEPIPSSSAPGQRRLEAAAATDLNLAGYDDRYNYDHDDGGAAARSGGAAAAAMSGGFMSRNRRMLSAEVAEARRALIESIRQNIAEEAATGVY